MVLIYEFLGRATAGKIFGHYRGFVDTGTVSGPVRSAGRGRFQAKSNKDSCFDPKYCCLISWSFAVSLRIFEAL